MKAVVDIETDALNATKIHCIVAQNYYTGQTWQWVGDGCKRFPEWAKGVDEFIMHNGLSFDAPILNRLLNTRIRRDQVRDTLIESQLYNPVRDGGHSLESWGKRLSFKNELERNIRVIIDKQQENGFAFDLMKGQLLLAKLEDEQHRLEEWADQTFPPVKLQMKTKVKEIPFNIASRKQIAERLMELGWKPTRYTDKDNIIVNEDVLSKIKKIPEAEMFNRYFLLQKRTGLLKAWIKECDENDRVHGKVLTLRTVTGRMAHHSPNMAQVPAGYSPYGKECRELWTVSNPETHQLVGTDASGLELRCLAHYMDDASFTNEVLTGDVHTANQKAAGLKTRDQAKTFIYAFLYGAGAGSSQGRIHQGS